MLASGRTTWSTGARVRVLIEHEVDRVDHVGQLLAGGVAGGGGRVGGGRGNGDRLRPERGRRAADWPLAHRGPHRRTGQALLLAVSGFGIATIVWLATPLANELLMWFWD